MLQKLIIKIEKLIIEKIFFFYDMEKMNCVLIKMTFHAYFVLVPKQLEFCSNRKYKDSITMYQSIKPSIFCYKKELAWFLSSIRVFKKLGSFFSIETFELCLVFVGPDEA